MIVNTIMSEPAALSLFWCPVTESANREADIECFMVLIETSWKSSIWTFYITTIFQTICYHNYRKWVHKSSLWSPLPWRRYIFLQLCFNSLFNVLECWITYVQIMLDIWIFVFSLSSWIMRVGLMQCSIQVIH